MLLDNAKEFRGYDNAEIIHYKQTSLILMPEVGKYI